MKLEGKAAIVTGAASGLGFATACGLAAAGAFIVAFDLDEARMTRLREQIEPSRLLLCAGSVAEEVHVAAAVDAAVERFGALHVAVNCAGVADAAKTVSKGEPFPLATWSKV
ncbi:MAG TPA: SDR family NAD(P)-dependent oxidoreductase, partial [Quisquiliibacterium sp.]|nr:SDR family NAD(P)-dependent oxidoreductase [Quisquiliibacterium sp.]